MLKAFVVKAKTRVKSKVVAALDVFRRIKNAREDFNYLPMAERMAAMPVATRTVEQLAGEKVYRYKWGKQ